jgi:hypothetical protein
MKRSKRLSNKSNRDKNMHQNKNAKGRAISSRKKGNITNRKNKASITKMARAKKLGKIKGSQTKSRLRQLKKIQNNKPPRRSVSSTLRRKSLSYSKTNKVRNKETKKRNNRLKVKPSLKQATTMPLTAQSRKSLQKNRIVRIMGQGQFLVNNQILKKLNQIDSQLVKLVSDERFPDHAEFRKLLLELTQIVQGNGKPLDPREIIQSDIILPSTDLSIEEAKKLFIGQGVVPEV